MFSAGGMGVLIGQIKIQFDKEYEDFCKQRKQDKLKLPEPKQYRMAQTMSWLLPVRKPILNPRNYIKAKY